MFLRFVLSTTITGEPYETSLQNFQDFIRFGETFNILNKNIYELGEANYSMKDDQLTHILYIERILPIRVGKKLKSATSDDNN
ncbi:unnamed protein product [Rotaria magnacalcarata]|uniref:Uncharacterized protein n=1 Tax=Rotaria magnacalcarata TaxID=392030 RepID=A0A8S3FSS3_9BILA|nr:unnamed protein product [Rotaria magnacalcarata]